MSRYLDLAWLSALDGGILCLKILAVMAPILLLYEISKVYGVFERPWPGLSRVMSFMGMGQKAVLPLMVGIFLGLVYGAGILVAMIRRGGLNQAERLALAVFLVTCHSVVEDTLIFTLVGGSAFGIIAPRLILALLLTAALARFIRGKKLKALDQSD
jgi:hypothetical protein